MFGLKSKKDKESIDKEIALYEKRRKLEIDESLSEYRRKEKNDALAEAKSFQDGRLAHAATRAKEEAAHEATKLAKATELANLTGEITARKAVEETQKAHRKLTEDARKEAFEKEREGFTSLVTEKDARISFLETLVTKLTTEDDKNVAALISSLGDAASKDHSTKVVGLGVAAVNAEKK